MQAYEDTLNATSRKHAPWFAIPADNKEYARLEIGKIIVDTVEKLECHYPEARDEEKKRFAEMEELLRNERLTDSD